MRKPVVVKCSNKDPGKDARRMCQVSCIGCGICQKVCPAGAITVTDNLSHIDESVCLSCGQCAVKCPPPCDLRPARDPDGKTVNSDKKAADWQPFSYSKLPR